MISGHVFIAVSLDGYIAREDGDIAWLLARDDPSEDHGYPAFIQNIDGIVMGRGTFEKVLDFEPWPYPQPIVVLSKTLKTTDLPERLRGKVRILSRDPKAAMAQLDKEGWKRVYIDGGQVIQAFLRENLIQDMVITTVPVLLGGGRSLFGTLSSDISLAHVETKTFPSGLVQSKYRLLK